jgi:uncharacterized protein
MSLRFVIVLLLFFVCFATPAWADFQAGMDAANRKDYATALHEWSPLAEQGDAAAQNNLGTLYFGGLGVPQDYALARLWYEKAAAQGHSDAQISLGLLYEKGQGVAQDYVQAHMWFNLAGANGDKRGVEFRDGLADRMTPAQIAEAQKLAREWKPKGK